ncbi:MAG: hypothetical protein KGS49_14235, partial [Planctomycetes bacterium]|nr:hypothetical protein [Planctomycetota bacterium]
MLGLLNAYRIQASDRLGLILIYRRLNRFITSKIDRLNDPSVQLHRIMALLLMAMLLMVLGFGATPTLAKEPDDSPESSSKLTKQEIQYFETRIRPILATKCYACHSVESGEAEGGLRLDSKEAMLRGGNSGSVITPKNPLKSLLIKAVEHQD